MRVNPKKLGLKSRPDEIKIVMNKDLVSLDVLKTKQKLMHMGLCIPDISYMFSLAVEYGTNWILRGFYDDFFKNIYVNGAHIINDWRNKDFHDMIKIQKPALAIHPELDTSFDRDNLDIGIGGTNSYFQAGKEDESFFKDTDKSLYLAMVMRLLLVKFKYLIKVSGKAMALNLQEFCRRRFWAKMTRSECIDTDFHIPTELMIALAKDVGFEVSEEANRIISLKEFMLYINKHSILPVSYKWRDSKGGFEFFIRVPDQIFHTKISEISIQEGDKQGKLDDDYIVSFETELRVPAPHHYMMMSTRVIDNILTHNKQHSFNMYSFSLNPIPLKDENGWPQYISFDYRYEDDEYKKKQPLKIAIGPTLMQIHRGRFVDLIKKTLSQYITPFKFMSVKAFTYNGTEIQHIGINWETFELFAEKFIDSRIIHIAFYLDMSYFNQMEAETHQIYSTRIESPGAERAMYKGVPYPHSPVVKPVK